MVRSSVYGSVITAWLLFMPASAAGTIDVYVIAGQSNAVGGAWPPTPSEELAGPRRSLYNFKLNLGGDGWREPNDWMTVQSLWPDYMPVSFGVEVGLTYELESRDDRAIAVVKVAQNGASLAGPWHPTTGDIYPWAIAKVQASLASLVEQGYAPRVKGLIWMGGEGDAYAPEWAAAYHDNLTLLADRFRADLGAPSMRLAYSLLNEHAQLPFVAELRTSQQLPIQGASYFDPSDLEMTPDGIHYPAASMEQLGRRFATLVPADPTPGTYEADFENDGDVDYDDLRLWITGFELAVWDGSDFLQWQREATLPPPDLDPATVPEPPSLWIALLAFGGGLSGAIAKLRGVRLPHRLWAQRGVWQ